jgi:hypothetical protein
LIENDKSSVPSVALGTMGKLLDKDEGRDAIHVAVYSSIAGESLGVGDRVSVRDGYAILDENGPGVVDPFLEETVSEGQRFWILLRPRMVTALRHVWEHPEFDDERAVAPEPVEPPITIDMDDDDDDGACQGC